MVEKKEEPVMKLKTEITVENQNLIKEVKKVSKITLVEVCMAFLVGDN